ncbi:hypothetical protein ACC731_38090, partial [Rhizobium ruizarguesonis]
MCRGNGTPSFGNQTLLVKGSNAAARCGDVSGGFPQTKTRIRSRQRKKKSIIEGGDMDHILVVDGDPEIR